MKDADTTDILCKEKQGSGSTNKTLQQFFHLLKVVLALPDFTFHCLLFGS